LQLNSNEHKFTKNAQTGVPKEERLMGHYILISFLGQ
jgi:hypothetical protein